MQAYAAAAANISVAIMIHVTWALILAISDASACCWAAPKAVVYLWCGGGGEDMHVVQLYPVEPSPIWNFRVCALIPAGDAAARWRLGLFFFGVWAFHWQQGLGCVWYPKFVSRSSAAAAAGQQKRFIS
jgi:hypothetical protein